MSGEAAAQFNNHDAETQQSRIVDRVELGEEIIPGRAGNPVAEFIAPIRRIDRVGRGSLRGRLVATEDWDSPEVSDAVAHDFGIAK